MIYDQEKKSCQSHLLHKEIGVLLEGRLIDSGVGWLALIHAVSHVPEPALWGRGDRVHVVELVELSHLEEEDGVEVPA